MAKGSVSSTKRRAHSSVCFAGMVTAHGRKFENRVARDLPPPDPVAHVVRTGHPARRARGRRKTVSSGRNDPCPGGPCAAARRRTVAVSWHSVGTHAYHAPVPLAAVALRFSSSSGRLPSAAASRRTTPWLQCLAGFFFFLQTSAVSEAPSATPPGPHRPPRTKSRDVTPPQMTLTTHMPIFS